MPYVTIPLSAIVVRDESMLGAKPAFINADKVRSVGGKMETIYGQEQAATAPLTGICRGAHTWADLARTAWGAFGTHLRLQVIDQDGILYDTTPVTGRALLSNPFSVSSGLTTITVSHEAHGLVADQLVTFPMASSAANVLITGAYTVSSVVSTSAYTFLASTAATQSTAGVGGTVDVECGLAPGNTSNLGGLGYGTGGYGSGGYGGPASAQDLDARTWSFANWGQNLIANPNWGAIYEWAPHIVAAESVGGGDFSSTATWVLGSGWSMSSGTSSASGGAQISQAVTLTRNAWHLLRFDVMHVSGAIQPLIGTASVGGAIATTGTYKRTFLAPSEPSQILAFDGGSTFNGGLDNVSLKVLTTANPLPGSPSSAGSVFVTAERTLVACGCTNASTGLLDPMRVAWSAAENNQDWTASAANVAGSYLLSHGTRLVRGLAGNRENLVFTDTAAYRMRYVPDPSVVYAFDLLGEGCGLIGANAAVQVDGRFFWLSRQGQFYQYAGGLPTPLPNPSARDLRDNLADVQGSKVYAGHLAARSEVWWFYPDERDGIECSRYHVFNYAEGTWVSGLYDRTSYTDAGVFPYPLATDSDGRVFYQEKDFSNDGGPRATKLESSYFNVAEGESFVAINGVRPDFEDLRGGVSLTFYSKNYPQDTTERVYGPFNITGATKRVSMRAKGRQIRFKLTTDDAPSFYRLGAMTFDVVPSGHKQ
jgi:hypothetical protein